MGRLVMPLRMGAAGVRAGPAAARGGRQLGRLARHLRRGPLVQGSCACIGAPRCAALTHARSDLARRVRNPRGDSPSQRPVHQGRPRSAFGRTTRSVTRPAQVAYSPDSSLVVTTAADSTIKLWGAETGALLYQVSPSPARSIPRRSPRPTRVLCVGEPAPALHPVQLRGPGGGRRCGQSLPRPAVCGGRQAAPGASPRAFAPLAMTPMRSGSDRNGRPHARQPAGAQLAGITRHNGAHRRFTAVPGRPLPRSWSDSRAAHGQTREARRSCRRCETKPPTQP
jgi:hypothetical protein